jgi:hypothetical protein
MAITSIEALMSICAPAIQSALKYTVEKIKEKNEQVVNQIVYAVYSPQMYPRTFELREAWKGEANASGASGHATFEYDPSKISAHSNLTDEAVPYLAEIVYQGLAGKIYGEGAWTQARDAWQALLDACSEDAIKEWFYQGCRQAGLPIER